MRIIKSSGFTLVEISLVLVIIGLIIGSILLGRSLIRSSELRSVTSEIQSFETAINTFRLKYECMPGDCTYATSFFGTDSAGSCPIGGGTTGTCNGNGNKYWGATSTENYHAWKQLALGNLIPGSYTGVSGTGSCGNGCASINGVNVPASKMDGGGYTAWLEASSWTTYYFNARDSNVFLFGAVNPTSYNSSAILTGAEASDIDIKLDDGSVVSGKVTVWKNKGTSCITSTSDTTSTYVTNSSTVACNLVYRLKNT